jgi:hypothetical protein
MKAAALRFGATFWPSIAFAAGCFEDATVHPFPPPGAGGGATDDAGGPAGAGTAARGGNSATGGTTGGTQPGRGGAATSGGTTAGIATGGTAGVGTASSNSGRAGMGTGGTSATGGTPSAGKSGSASGGTSGGNGPSPSAGKASAGGSETGGNGGTEEVPAGYVEGIIAVGYGGLRVVSRDAGKTWGDAVAFGEANADDENLLRAVTYGKGRWIATGWRLLYSDDGIEWTEHAMVRDEFEDQQIIEGLAYEDGYFYAAGDPGRLYRSADGLSWEAYGAPIGDTEKHTTLAFRGGLFVSYGDSSTSFQSADGSSWSQMNVADATYCERQWRTLAQCHDAAWFDGGFYLRVEWGGQIQRSTDGSDFSRVYQDPDEHTAYKSITFAQGYVAP